MLAIHSASPKKCTPNLLPCRIDHNGPVNSASRFWTPESDEKGTSHVHFRGRHLHGTSVLLPQNYTGAILNVTDESISTSSNPSNALRREDDDNEAEEDAEMDTEEIKIAEQIGTFDEIMIWEHGGKVDVENSAFVKGIGEWIGFAEGMHCDDEHGVISETGKEKKES
ncbi:ribonuclease H2 non-catalytic subunit-domain-containing protein [Phaeosphaeria sp. MPI-PUGE-AT-0046c]|nr:ribonuclease H2 non-catalytic subunit-domain-containing protein [Phaeosphaeria sp. MPI-PUGE-AT-0046c]